MSKKKIVKTIRNAIFVENEDGSVTKYYPASTPKAKAKPNPTVKSKRPTPNLASTNRVEPLKSCCVILKKLTNEEIARALAGPSKTVPDVSWDIDNLCKRFSRDWFAEKPDKPMVDSTAMKIASKQINSIDNVINAFKGLKIRSYEEYMLSVEANGVLPVMPPVASKQMVNYKFARKSEAGFMVNLSSECQIDRQFKWNGQDIDWNCIAAMNSFVFPQNVVDTSFGNLINVRQNEPKLNWMRLSKRQYIKSNNVETPLVIFTKNSITLFDNAKLAEVEELMDEKEQFDDANNEVSVRIF